MIGQVQERRSPAPMAKYSTIAAQPVASGARLVVWRRVILAALLTVRFSLFYLQSGVLVPCCQAVVVLVLPGRSALSSVCARTRHKALQNATNDQGRARVLASPDIERWPRY
jgi:hypothetical protein